MRSGIKDALAAPLTSSMARAAPAPRSKLAWAVAAGLAVLMVAASYALWRATQPVDRPLVPLVGHVLLGMGRTDLNGTSPAWRRNSEVFPSGAVNS